MTMGWTVSICPSLGIGNRSSETVGIDCMHCTMAEDAPAAVDKIIEPQGLYAFAVLLHKTGLLRSQPAGRGGFLRMKKESLLPVRAFGMLTGRRIYT